MTKIFIKTYGCALNQLELNMNLNANRLRTRSLKSINRFLELEGFIKGIKNSSKSKYYNGIEKNAILKSLLKE